MAFVGIKELGTENLETTKGTVAMPYVTLQTHTGSEVKVLIYERSPEWSSAIAAIQDIAVDQMQQQIEAPAPSGKLVVPDMASRAGANGDG